MNVQAILGASATSYSPIPECGEQVTLVLGNWEIQVPIKRLQSIGSHFMVALNNGFVESKEKRITLHIQNELSEKTRKHFAAFVLEDKYIASGVSAFDLLILGTDNNIPGLVSHCMKFLLHTDPSTDPVAFTTLIQYASTIENVEVAGNQTFQQLVTTLIIEFLNHEDLTYNLAALECILKANTSSEFLDSILWYYFCEVIAQEGMDCKLHFGGHVYPKASSCMRYMLEHRRHGCSPSNSPDGARTITLSSSRPNIPYTDLASQLNRLTLGDNRILSCQRLEIVDCLHIDNSELQAISKIWGKDVKQLHVRDCPFITSLQNTTFPSLEKLSIRKCGINNESLKQTTFPLKDLDVEDNQDVRTCEGWPISGLVKANFGRTKLTNEGLQELSRLCSGTLVHLDIINCVNISSLSDFPNLTTVYAQGSYLSQKDKDFLRSLTVQNRFSPNLVSKRK